METAEMVIDGKLHQIEVYPEVTDLDDEELAWLGRQTRSTPAELADDPYLRQMLFEHQWTGLRVCFTCGRREGKCNNRDCIKVRVTNKLHLYDWSDWRTKD